MEAGDHRASVEPAGQPLGSFGQLASAAGEGMTIIGELSGAEGFDGTSPYAPEAYDATALFLLAMQAAGSTDPAEYGPKVLEVANAPGEPILPGELAKGLQILADGGQIDYVGASSVELIGPGESAGSYRELEVKDGEFATISLR